MAGNNSTKVLKKKKLVKTKRNASTSNALAAYAPGAPVSTLSMVGRKSTMPRMIQMGDKCTVKNYELCAIFPTGNSAFQAQGLYINPGIVANFPWLAPIALNFQKFKFRQLRFFFSSSCPTSTVGKVWMSASYDFLDSAPSTFAVAVTSQNCSTGPAWFGGTINEEKAFERGISAEGNIYIDYDCTKFAQPWYYVRAAASFSTGGSITGTPTGGLGTLAFVQGSNPEASGLPGRLFYGNSSVTTNTIPGELYVSYIIDFTEPVATASNT